MTSLQEKQERTLVRSTHLYAFYLSTSPDITHVNLTNAVSPKFLHVYGNPQTPHELPTLHCPLISVLSLAWGTSIDADLSLGTKPGLILLPLDPAPSSARLSPQGPALNRSDISQKSGKKTDYLLIIGKDIPQFTSQDAQQGAHNQCDANWKRQRQSTWLDPTHGGAQRSSQPSVPGSLTSLHQSHSFGLRHSCSPVGRTTEEMPFSCGSQRGVPGPAALASCGNLLEMQVLRYHLQPAESETLPCGAQQSPGPLIRPFRGFQCCEKPVNQGSPRRR